MSIRVKEIAREVVAGINSDAGYELAAQFVWRRYQELVSKARFRHLRQYGQLYLPAPLVSGTVTVTQDSFAVTGDATALAAWQASKYLKYPDDFQGLFFRPAQGRTWYRIAQVNGAVLTLETPLAADNGSLFTSGVTMAGVGYYIVPRFTKLDPTARTLGTFVADYVSWPIKIVSEDQLNMAATSSRFLLAGIPRFVAELNNDLNADGQPKQVEFYPYPQTSITVHYTFWQHPPEIANPQAYPDALIPPVIDRDILKTGAKADLYEREAAQAARSGNVEAAGFFRNSKNQEETKFEAKVARAVRNDRGMDDLKFLLQRGWNRGRSPLDWDPVNDAESNFLARGW